MMEVAGDFNIGNNLFHFKQDCQLGAVWSLAILLPKYCRVLFKNRWPSYARMRLSRLRSDEPQQRDVSVL
jgi:hypothetical protein